MKSEWMEYTFDELVVRNQGVNTTTEKVSYSESGFPVIRANNIGEYTIDDSNIVYVNSETFLRIKNPCKPKINDILYTNIGSQLGNAAKVKISYDFIIAWNVLRLQVNELIDSDFMVYTLNSAYYKKYIRSLNSSSTMPFVSGTELGKIKFTIPPLKIQKKIAHILSTLDDKIELNRKMNQTLEEMAQALFKSWFVDFDPVHAKLTCKSDEELEVAARELGISKEVLELFPSKFEESELGRIPEGWSVKKLGECELEIESGTRPKGGIDKELSFGMPSVGAESIAPIGIFDFSNVKYVTNEFAAKAKRGWVQNMDVALYKDGGKPGIFMPRVSLYGNEYPFKKFMINEHVFLLRSTLLGQHYLFQLISSKSILDQLIAKGSAKAAQPGLNQAEVNDSKFVLPSKKLLLAFNEYVEIFVNKQLENGKQIQILQQTRDTLLPKLLSGELDVSEIYIEGL